MNTTEKQTVLEIPCTKRDDTGRYTITLKNSEGTFSASASVTVIGTSHDGSQKLSNFI